MSSLAGLAPGVAGYRKDISDLGKEQIALSRVEAAQRANEIAAAKRSRYIGGRDNLWDSVRGNPTYEVFKDGKPTGKPTTAFEEMALSRTQTSVDPSAVSGRLMSEYVRFEKSKAGRAELGKIKDELTTQIMKDNPDLSKSEARRQAISEAPLLLFKTYQRRSMGGGAQTGVRQIVRHGNELGFAE